MWNFVEIFNVNNSSLHSQTALLKGIPQILSILGSYLFDFGKTRWCDLETQVHPDTAAAAVCWIHTRSYLLCSTFIHCLIYSSKQALSGDENENSKVKKKSVQTLAQLGEWQYPGAYRIFLTPNSLLSSDEQVNFRLKALFPCP